MSMNIGDACAPQVVNRKGRTLDGGPAPSTLKSDIDRLTTDIRHELDAVKAIEKEAKAITADAETQSAAKLKERAKHFLQIGRDLIEAYKEIKPAFRPKFLKGLGISNSTAKTYMKLAKAKDGDAAVTKHRSAGKAAVQRHRARRAAAKPDITEPRNDRPPASTNPVPKTDSNGNSVDPATSAAAMSQEPGKQPPLNDVVDSSKRRAFTNSKAWLSRGIEAAKETMRNMDNPDDVVTFKEFVAAWKAGD